MRNRATRAGPRASGPVPHDGPLLLPHRTDKPRDRGLTVLIDAGAPVGYFTDVMASSAAFIDVVKFGWGTALATARLQEKISCLKKLGISFYFGGTLFEKYYVQGRLDQYYRFCTDHGAGYLEISNGTVNLSHADKARLIREASGHFAVLSEVGYKDEARSQELSASDWVRLIEQDLAAGAVKTITEARESGTSGICRADGSVRTTLVDAIQSAGINPDRLIFEAPTKSLQTYFITRLGSNVNLANVALSDAVGVETLRLGLRADTLLWSEGLEPYGAEARAVKEG